MVNYSVKNDILIAPELAFGLSVIVADTGITANTEGRKIIPAGTPLYVATGKSILKDRQEVMITSSENSAVLSGIARYDIDVTGGNANATLLIAGYVDRLKLTTSVRTLVDAITFADIKFINGGAF